MPRFNDSPGRDIPDKRGTILSAVTLTNNSCKGGIKKGLIDLNVCIEDTSRTSSDYFNITKCEDKFTVGSNAVSFQANARMFKPGSEIQVEVLDAHGNAIKHEIKRNTNADSRTRTICFFVCDDTPTGPGIITFTGIAVLDNNCFCPLPADCQDRINVRWSRKIYIDPSLINDEPIDWYEAPIVKVEERVVPWSHVTVEGQTNTFTTAAPTLYHDTSATGSDKGAVTYEYDGVSQFATCKLHNADYTTFYESDGTTQLAGSNVKSAGDAPDTASLQWVDGTINFHKFYSAATVTDAGSKAQFILEFDNQTFSGENMSLLYGKTIILIDASGTANTFTLASSGTLGSVVAALTTAINSTSSFSAVYALAPGRKDFWITIDQASVGTSGNTTVAGTAFALAGVDGRVFVGDGYADGQTSFSGGTNAAPGTVAYSYGANQNQNIGRGVFPHEINHSTAPPLHRFAVPSSSNLLPAAMSTTIRQIVSQNEFLVDPLPELPILQTPGYVNHHIQRIGYIQEGGGAAIPFVIRYEGSEGTVTTKDPDTHIAIDQSYASINIRNLKPCCSEVTHVNVFIRSHHKLGYGDNSGFEFLNVMRLHPTNFMVDKDTTSYSDVSQTGHGGTQFINFGRFTNQPPLSANNILQSYWQKGSSDKNEDPLVAVDNSKLIGGVKICHNGVSNNINEDNDTYYTFKPQFSHSLAPGSSSFFSGSTYQVKFNAYGESDQYSTGGPSKFERGNPRIDIYMSGSSFKADYEDKGLGRRITTIETKAATEKYINNTFVFDPDNDGHGAPVFVVRRGCWHLANIELTAASGSGLTPSIMDGDLAMPIQPASDVFDFKFEYLNYAGIPAKGTNSITYIYNIPFLGTDLNAIANSHANHPSQSNTTLIFTTSSVSFPTNITNIFSTGSWQHTGSMHVTGTIHATELIIGVVSKSMLFASGSSKFGDDCDDTHQFSGSVSIAGNLDITDTLCEGGGNISSSYIYARSASISEISSSIISSSIISGSYIWGQHITGSLFGTASWAGSSSYAETASYALHARSASWADSASQATTASYAHFAASASHAVSSSFIQTSSYAHTSSWAMTASYVSGGLGQSDIYNIFNTHLTTSHIHNHGEYSGSFIFANSASFNSASITNLTSSNFYSNNITNTGNYSGSFIFANSASFNSASTIGLTFTHGTGSLQGTASFAGTSSYAITASYSMQARSASWADSASQAITASYGRDNDWFKQGKTYADGNEADPTIDGDIYHLGKAAVGDFSTATINHKFAVEGTTKLGNNVENEHNITGSIHMKHTALSILSGSGNFGIGTAKPGVKSFSNTTAHRLQVYDGSTDAVGIQVINWETASAYIAGGGVVGGNTLAARGPRAVISINAINSSASYGYGGTRGQAGGSIAYLPDTFEGNTSGNDIGDGNDRDSEGVRLLQEVLHISTGGNPQGSINIHARGDAGQQIRFFTGNDDARNTGGSGIETQRMTIRHDGQVGIGTHAPSRRLHVSNSIGYNSDPIVRFETLPSASNSGFNIVMVNATGDLYQGNLDNLNQSNPIQIITSSNILHLTSSNIINHGSYSGSFIFANSASFNSASMIGLTFTHGTGSLLGTSSFANFAGNAFTASHAVFAESASWAESASQAITASYGRDNDWYKQGKSYSDGNEADPTLDGDIYHTGKVGIGDFSTAGIDHQLAVEGTAKIGNNVANEHNITGSIHMQHTNLSILSGSGRFGFGIAKPGVIAFDNSSTRRLQIYDGDPTAVFLNVTNWETASAFIAGGGTPGGNQLTAQGPRAGISVNALNSSASYGYGGTRGIAGGSISYHPDTFEGNTNGNDVSDGNDRDSEGNRLLQEVLNITTGGNPQGSINIHARGDAGQQIRFFTGNDDARNSGGKNVETLRMTIKHDGEVGIGTHDPARRLHVSKSIDEGATTPIVRFETLPTAPDNTNIVVVDSNGDLYQTSKIGTVGGNTTIDDNLIVLGNFSGSHIFANSASINEVSISKTLIVGHMPDPTDTFTNHFISMSSGNVSMSGWISSSNTASFGHGKFTDIRITNDAVITRDTTIGRSVYVTNAEAVVDIEGSLDVNGSTDLDNTDIDGTLVVDGSNISLDSTSTLNIDNSNTTNGITIGTATANVPIKIGRGDVTTTIEGNTNIRGNVSSSYIYANSASINEVSISRTLIIGHIPDPTDTFTNHFISMSSGNVSMSGWISSSNTGSFGYGKFSDTVEATNTGSFTHTVATTVKATNVNTTNVTATTIEVGQDIDVTRNIKSNGSNINTIYSPIAGGTNIVTVGTIGTGVWNGTAIATAYIANDAIDADKIADDVINSEHIAAGSVDTEHIADNQVTLDKLAGLARGKIIYGNASGDPAALSLGSNGEVLLSDGTDISWGSAPAPTGAQTGITSIKHNSLIIGGNSQNNTIDFGTDDKIIFDIDNVETVLIHSTGLDVHGTVSASYGSFTSGSFNTLVIGSGSRPSNYGGLTLTEISASGNISSSGTIYASTGSIGRVESDALKGTKIFGSGAHLDNDVNLDRGSDARGDILYRGTTDYVRLAGGSANTVLIMGDADPTWNTVGTNSITDNAVTLAKMAGLARGKIIYGDASGDPAALSAGANGKLLVADANGDLSWTTVSGDVTLSAGAITIAATSIEGSMLNNNIVSGLTDIGAAIAATDEFIISDAGTIKRSDISRLGTFLAGDGLTVSSGVLAVGVDDSSIEINSDAIRVKAGGIATAMIADDAVDADKLASNAVVNASVASSAAIAFTKLADLTNGNILIGNAGNDATSTTVSGDVTITGTGVTTIGATKVHGTMLNSDVAGTGLTIAGNNLDIEAAQTGITSIKHNSLILGGNSQNNTIDFGTDDKIIFDIDNVETALVHSTGLDVHGTISGSFGSFTSGSFNTLVIGSGSKPSNYGDMLVGAISMSGNITGSSSATASMGRATFTRVHTSKVVSDTTDISLDMSVGRAIYVAGSNLTAIYSPIAGNTSLVTLGTITTGEWNGTVIAHDYIGADAIDATNIADDAIEEEHIGDGEIKTAAIADDQVTYAKIQNVSATNKILGRDSAGAGVIEEISPANLVTMLGIEASATADQTKSDIDGLGITTVGTIDTGVWNGTAITHDYIGADAIDGTNIGNDVINSEHYVAASIDNEHLADNAVNTDEIADNAVTLDKMAGIARGKIIIGNSSGDPSALAAGTNGYVLTSDGTDISWAESTSATGNITGITSVKHNSLIIGGNSQNNTIDFGTDDKIIFDIDNIAKVTVGATETQISGITSGSFASYTSGSFNTLVIGSGSVPSNYGGLTLTEISASGNISSSGTIYASTGSIGRVESAALKGTKIFGSGAHLDNDVNLDRGSDARGDILYRGASNYQRLAGGSANHVLIMGDADPTWNTVGTNSITDNAVTLAKMAGLARGKIIVGDASGDPSALAAGANGKILVADANGDPSWTTLSGDASLSAGALTIAATSIEGSMLNNNIVSGLTDIGAAIAATDEFIISDAGTIKRSDISRLGTFLAGDGLAVSSGVLAVGVDDSSIEISSDALRVKAAGITNAMLADNAADTDEIADNAVTLAKMAGLARGKIIVGDASGDPSALGSGANGKILVADANGDPSWTTLSGDASLSAGALTIAATSVEGSMLNNNIVSGLTDIGAAIAATDEIIISDAGTIKRSDISRLGTFLAGDGLAVSSGVLAVGVDDSSIEINSDALRVKAQGITNAMLADNAADTDEIADNAVTLAKLAGLARGKIIYGDSSGDPAALALGSNGEVLLSDGTDISWGSAPAASGAQTGITTLYNTGTIIGRAANDTTIDFTTDDKIILDAGSTEIVEVNTGGIDISGKLEVIDSIADGDDEYTGYGQESVIRPAAVIQFTPYDNSSNGELQTGLFVQGAGHPQYGDDNSAAYFEMKGQITSLGGSAVPYNATSSIKLAETTGWGGNRNMSGIRMVTEVNDTGGSKRAYGIVNTVRLKKAYTNGSNEKLLGVYHTVSGTLSSISNDGTGVAGGGQAHPDVAGAYILNMFGGAEGPEATNPAENQAYTLFTSSSFGGFGSGKSVFMESVGILNAKPNVIGLTVNGTVSSSRLNVLGDAAITGTLISANYTIGGHTIDDIDITSEFVDADAHIMSSKAIGARFAQKNADTTGNANTATALETSRNLQVALGSEAAQGFTGAANATSIGVTGILASANMDADTAHLTTAQTFTGVKTFGTTTKLQFRDANAFINSPTANDIEVAATTITLDAASDIQLEGDTSITGFVSASGVISATGGVSGSISGDRIYQNNVLNFSAAGEHEGEVVYFGGSDTVAGDLYYLNSSGGWTQTDADTLVASTGMLAVACGASSDAAGMLIRGFIRSSTALGTRGGKVYLSTTPGDMAEAIGASGDYTRIIGHVVDATNNTLYFNPSNAYVLRS